MARRRAKDAAPSELARNQLYTLAFTSEHGDAALADLEKHFCDKPSYDPGMPYEEVAYREGAKSVIRFIRQNLRLGLEPRQVTAKTEED